MALGLADLSPMNFKLGAVIIDKKRRVIGSGHNSYKTHPVFGSTKNHYRYLHAEGMALYDAYKKGLETVGCEIFISRRGGNLARPCPYCMSLLKEHGITRAHYTSRKGRKTVYQTVEIE